MAINVNFPAWEDMVNEPFKDLLENKDRYILLWGGRGSGKTDSTQKKIIIRLLTAPYFKGVLVRKVYDTIKESQYEGIKNEIYNMGLESLFKFTVSPLSIKCMNGNRLLARGLDKAEKIKGIDNPSFVWYEEGNDMTEDDFNTVTTTIRSKKADYLQEIFSFNPETEEPNFSDFWIHKKFFSHTNDKTFRSSTEVEVEINGEVKTITYAYTSIHSTYKDNPHLPPVTKATYEDFRRTNPYYYTVYTLGMWGNKEVGSRFYKTFTMGSVRALEYDPRLPLHISLDENVNPYLTLTIHQIAQDHAGGFEARQLGEICLKSPNNTLRATCEEFSRMYHDHKEGLYIYGDRTSKKQDTKLEKGENFFTLVRNYLASYNPIERLPSRNPGVKSRGEFINQIFAGNIKGAKIAIGDKSSNSIADYLYLKEAADGLKFKEKTTDKVSKVRYEKYGHCFIKGTLVRTESGNKPIEDIKAGELVWTAKGLRRVVRSGITRRNAEVKTYTIAGKQITCTPDHKIYTVDKGFKEVDLLIGTHIFCIFGSWKKKQKSIEGVNSTDTQELKTCPTVNILKVGQRTAKKPTYIDLCIVASLGLFQKVTTYTIKTATLIITLLKTSLYYPLQNTTGTTGKKKPTSKRSEQKKYYGPKHNQKRPSGTQVKRGESGTLNTLEMSTKKTSELLPVRSAGRKRKAVTPLLSFVLSDAKTDLTQGFTADVYDLTVQGQHEFFANDILVHNCSDANDYLYCEIFKPQFDNFIGGGIIKKPIFGRRKTKKGY